MGRSLWRHRNLPGLMSELNPMNVKQRWVLTDNLLWVDHRVGRLRTAVLLWCETHAKRIALMQEARPRLTVSRVVTHRQTRTGGWKLRRWRWPQPCCVQVQGFSGQVHQLRSDLREQTTDEAQPIKGKNHGASLYFAPSGLTGVDVPV